MGNTNTTNWIIQVPFYIEESLSSLSSNLINALEDEIRLQRKVTSLNESLTNDTVNRIIVSTRNIPPMERNIEESDSIANSINLILDKNIPSCDFLVSGSEKIASHILFRSRLLWSVPQYEINSGKRSRTLNVVPPQVLFSSLGIIPPPSINTVLKQVWALTEDDAYLDHWKYADNVFRKNAKIILKK